MSHSHSVQVYRRNPPYGVLATVLAFAATGGFIAYRLFLAAERLHDADRLARGRLVLAVTVILCGVTLIAGTARFWFRHLRASGPSRVRNGGRGGRVRRIRA